MKKSNFLKTFVLASTLMPALCLNAQSKLDKEVLMTIGDEKVTVKDFTDVYYKNNLKTEVIEKKSVDDYLDLFINFRMKVMEAEAQQLDIEEPHQLHRLHLLRVNRHRPRIILFWPYESS